MSLTAYLLAGLTAHSTTQLTGTNCKNSKHCRSSQLGGAVMHTVWEPARRPEKKGGECAGRSPGGQGKQQGTKAFNARLGASISAAARGLLGANQGTWQTDPAGTQKENGRGRVRGARGPSSSGHARGPKGRIRRSTPGTVLVSRCGHLSSVLLSPHFLQTTLVYTPGLEHLAV